ncbi:uncharacterized protein LOC133896121 [Phragmites australis]|uniref:uncharacterized protein LOC133896121 n=1 Tax=Phragmites australis TaxID=29695 RepID=UPI002D79D0FE|nr:uncharacterized protein LOC133896121 [Phragmites australis]
MIVLTFEDKLSPLSFLFFSFCCHGNSRQAFQGRYVYLRAFFWLQNHASNEREGMTLGTLGIICDKGILERQWASPGGPTDRVIVLPHSAHLSFNNSEDTRIWTRPPFLTMTFHGDDQRHGLEVLPSILMEEDKAEESDAVEDMMVKEVDATARSSRTMVTATMCYSPFFSSSDHVCSKFLLGAEIQIYAVFSDDVCFFAQGYVSSTITPQVGILLM